MSVDGRDDVTIAASDAGAPRVGSVFAGRYLIERQVGRGGMGMVYCALDRQLGERVALKILTVPDEKEAALERFRREVRVARRVTHRNAARTYDIGEHGGFHYLTMELIEGRSLERELGCRRLDLATLVDIGVQICAGLAAAHEAGIVHRDLKPANVLVEPQGRVAITDFGIARAVSEGNITVDGGLVGTLAYMAPEQIRGRPADTRSDIYALGLILFEMATGRSPFPADTPLASALARMDAPPPDPRDVAAVPDPLAELVLHCLQPDPDRRPAHVREIEKRLQDLHDAATTVSDETRAAEDPTRVGHRTATSSTSAPTAGTSSSFVSVRPAGRGLAVLPFKYRGPADDAYIAEALTDELIDALSMTKGLKVPASGATTKFAEDRDPKRIGEELGVDAFVDGSVQRAGGKLRISARLVDTATALQIWSDHYTGELEDVFELQDRMAKRIAETLRVELNALTHRGAACAEAIALYLRARRYSGRTHGGSIDRDNHPVVLFERALELAPDFAPAIAGYAQACIGAWFLPGFRGMRDWAQASRDAVARALEKAPDLAETHYAAARLASQLGDYGEAARCLAMALEIAPTYADAHEYLGTLQTEGGRPREGIRHIELAIELDPTLAIGRVVIARYHALHGDMDAFERELERLKMEFVGAAIPVAVLELRVASWVGDTARAHAVAAYFRRFDDRLAIGDVARLADLFLGEVDVEALERSFAPREQDNPRFLALMYQMITEALCLHGRPEVAMRYLKRANANNLLDLDWIDHCPALASLRERSAFAAVRLDVARRAQSVWTR